MYEKQLLENENQKIKEKRKHKKSYMSVREKERKSLRSM